MNGPEISQGLDTARILDRGYRSFDGERTGLRGAMWTVTKHSMRNALGLKRKASTKVLPFLSIALAFVPAIVFVGIVALFKDIAQERDLLPTYAEYYGFVSAAIFVFSAFVTPELLCPDRRSGLLGMYLASPLDRNTYLLAKAAAVGIILSIVTMGPQLLILVSYTILERGPDGFSNWIETLLRIILGGLCVSALHTTLGLAISSLTTRKGVASASIIITLFASAALSAALVEATDSPNYFLLHLLALPLQAAHVVFGERRFGDFGRLNDNIVVLVNIGWIVVFGVFVWWRYRRIAVTK